MAYHRHRITDIFTLRATLDALATAAGSDLTYTAATRVLASSTGADATLPLLSSSDAGLAPASGGGSTNFLRADGTWAEPVSAAAAFALFFS